MNHVGGPKVPAHELEWIKYGMIQNLALIDQRAPFDSYIVAARRHECDCRMPNDVRENPDEKHRSGPVDL